VWRLGSLDRYVGYQAEEGCGVYGSEASEESAARGGAAEGGAGGGCAADVGEGGQAEEDLGEKVVGEEPDWW
jgi:hypothetical protein